MKFLFLLTSRPASENEHVKLDGADRESRGKPTGWRDVGNSRILTKFKKQNNKNVSTLHFIQRSLGTQTTKTQKKGEEAELNFPSSARSGLKCLKRKKENNYLKE